MFTAILISSLLLVFAQGSVPQDIGLLLATDDGVKVFSVSKGISTIHTQPASAVDFRYDKKDIYFVSNSSSQIFYSFLSSNSQRYIDPLALVTSPHGLSDLVTDWRGYTLYYSRFATEDIIEVGLMASNPRTIEDNVHDVLDLALDPYERLLFFVDQDNFLIQHNLTTSESVSYDFSGKVYKVALDLHRKEVYVISQDDDDHWHLLATGYGHYDHSHVVSSGPQLAGARAVTVFNGQVAWAIACDRLYCLYLCQPIRDGQCRGTTTVWEIEEVINDVKFYNAMVQTPDKEAACQLCSHNCSVDNWGYVQCTCPDHMEIDVYGNICRDKPPSWIQSIKNFLSASMEDWAQWFKSLEPDIVTFIYVCCALMLTLSLCGLFLLLTCVNFKYTVTEPEYDLSDSSCFNRKTNRNR